MSLFSTIKKVEDFLNLGNDVFTTYINAETSNTVDLSKIAYDAVEVAADLKLTLPTYNGVSAVTLVTTFITDGLNGVKALKPTA